MQMVKRYRRLNHGLEEKFFVRPDWPHPPFFPRVMRGVILTGVVQIDSGDVLDRILQEVRFSVVRRRGRHC